MTSGIYPRPSPEERFWSKVEKTETCWNWKGCKNGMGYGLFHNNKMIPAHRFSYELLVGVIPNSLQIDHLCRNRACVNPAHLDVVSCRENILRGLAGWISAIKTHCIHGHEYNEENTRYYHAARYCRRCHREYMRKYYHKEEIQQVKGRL